MLRFLNQHLHAQVHFDLLQAEVQAGDLGIQDSFGHSYVHYVWNSIFCLYCNSILMAKIGNCHYTVAKIGNWKYTVAKIGNWQYTVRKLEIDSIDRIL